MQHSISEESKDECLVEKIGFKRKHGREEFIYLYLTILNTTHQFLKFMTCSG
jgi:hypothetical protein